MNENKLGRKFASTWGNVRNRTRHNIKTRRMANKGVRKNAKLLIKNGEVV